MPKTDGGGFGHRRTSAGPDNLGNQTRVAYGLARQLTRSDSAKERFEYNRGFRDIIFGKTASLLSLK